MPSYNINSGYGRTLANFPFTGYGKTFIVGTQTGARADMLKDVVIPDPDGQLRFFSTISEALAQCTANAGDVIYVLPGYTETVTSVLNINVAGVSVIGVGNKTTRPQITGNGTIDCVRLSAAGISFYNFGFPAPETDDQTAVIDITGAGCRVGSIRAIGSQTAKNVVDMITVAATASNLILEDIEFENSVVAVNSFISFEGAANDVTLRNVSAVGLVVAAGIIDAAQVTNLKIEYVTVVVSGTTKSAIVLDSNPTGWAKYVFAKGTQTTLASNVNYGNALALFEVRTSEDFSVQGAIIPVQDTE